MENYTSIYNFWFNTDIVPTVPLTSPTDGWNYWKYGRCFTKDISNDEYRIDIIKNWGIYISGQINRDIVEQLALPFSQWKSVEDYYNKELYKSDKPGEHLTLYSFLYTVTGTLSTGTGNKIGYGINAILDGLGAPQLSPLIAFAFSNLGTIKKSHLPETYNSEIKSTGSENFNPITYQDIVNRSTATSSAAVQTQDEVQTEYNTNELEKLKAFANSNGNNDILKWDLDNPSTWSGVKWSDNGNVVAIDFTYKWLKGELDLSNFAELKEAKLYANMLTGIDLASDKKLESLNCSYNDLKSNRLDLKDCTSLQTLFCDGCGISYLNISQLTKLKKLSCLLNNIYELNIESNTNLEYIDCTYNYLDVHKGGQLYKQILTVAAKEKSFVNYQQQLLPENATVDADEMAELKKFAQYGNNNEKLDWLDDNSNISISKLQNNVLFAYDGSIYRIVAINLSGSNVGGNLDLAAFDELEALYCDETNISKIDLAVCTKLQDLRCNDSELDTLILPANANDSSSELYRLECQGNHLDTKMFSKEVISNIKSKTDYVLNYKKQSVKASDVSAFWESDYSALTNIYNQGDNKSVLNWDISAPNTWSEIGWTYDYETEKYKMYSCDFSSLDITGNIDFSECTLLDSVSFANSKIETVTLPIEYIENSAFKGCDRLEAVVLSNTKEIKQNAFKSCTALQAIYIPQSVESIAENSFDSCNKLTLVGVLESYANTYANENSLIFNDKLFFCGKIVSRENLNDKNEHNYPISNVKVGDNVVTDEYGYFVVFDLEAGKYDYLLDYKYGFKRNINVTISITPLIAEKSISIVNGDWINDGTINARDYAFFSRYLKGLESFDDYTCLDINKDGKINDDDWSITSKFMMYSEDDELKNTLKIPNA